MMRILRYILVFFLLHTATSQLKAQFVDIDWAGYECDTILPCYTTVIDLPDDYHLYEYSVAVEYPEFQPMSDKEIKRYALDTMRDSLPVYPRATASVSISAKMGQLDIRLIPIVYANGKFLRINSFKPVIKRTMNIKAAMSRIASRTTAGQRYSISSVLDSGRWVKIAVRNEGVYKITDAELRKMGFKNPSKVRLYGYGGRILPETDIHLLPDDLKEIPLWREQGYSLFFANGTIRWTYNGGRFTHRQNVFSQLSYYFLTESDEAPLAFPVKELNGTTKEYTTFPDYALYEKEELSLSTYGNILLDSYNFASGRSVSYKFALDNVVEDTRATVDVSFGSNATESSRVSVDVNGNVIGSLGLTSAGSNEHGRISKVTLAAPAGLTANTTIKLTHTTSNSGLSGHLDYICLNFERRLALNGSYTTFRGSSTNGNARFKISSATADTHVWQVTDQAATCELSGTLSDGVLTVAAPASYNEQLVAVNVKGNFPSVTVIGDVKNQNLHSMGATDMLIIVPSNGAFLTAAQRLAEAHASHRALRVNVVTAEQIYNEFSSGTPDATAYRRMMKMLYDRAETAADAPKYLLLFGDGVTDNRLITYPRLHMDNLLLTYQSENSVSAVRSYVLEDYYAFLDDSEGSSPLQDKIDIAVGRLPVQTAADAEAVVDKLTAYMRNDVPGSWQNVMTMMGDDGDKSIPNQHMIDAEDIATIIAEENPSFIIDRIYWDEYPMEVLATGNSYPEVTKSIYERLEKGALVVNYSGHGSANLLSHEMSWKASDMAAIKSPRIPFWVTASCDITPFDMGDGSLGEAAILNPDGAAIGLLTTTRTVLQSYNAIINQEFMRQLVKRTPEGSLPSVGDAMRKAKCNIIDNNKDLYENKLQFIIIGDPALCLNMPTYKVVIEKFNNATAGEHTTVQAGGNVSIEGYVATDDGTIAQDFTGVVSPTLFDCIEDVYTRDNTGLGAFNYTAYRKTLFTGSDSVIGGRFKLTIPVPMDISYSNEQGMLNLFAVDTLGRSAQGHYNCFDVGGTAPSIENDGKGPQIEMYLNTPDFVNGDEVNSTPCLYVTLFDKDGINTVGTGIGHDIVAIIDNDKNHTYNLNRAFTPHVGDYRKGSIEFTIGELAAGEHTLLLRAWDIFNNSSTDTIHFVTVPNLAPEFVDITTSSNPINSGEKMEFTLTHDRPGSTLDITIELFNFQGQALWMHTQKEATAGSTIRIPWDGTTNEGRPLPTGVYLYRARLSSTESNEQTKTRKLIILNNK